MRDYSMFTPFKAFKSGCGCLILLVGFPILFFLSFFGCSCDNCFPIGDNKPAEIANTIEEGPTMYTVVCQGCGVEWESSSNTPMTDCYHCQATLCDEGLMIAAPAAMIMADPNWERKPKSVEAIRELEAKIKIHAKDCKQCRDQMKE